MLSIVKLYYKNSESAIAALRAYRYMKGMRDSKGPITSSALKKMMKEFEATGSLASRQRSGRSSTAAAVAKTVEQTVQSMSAVAAHGECSARENFEADRSDVWQCLESIVNNSETVSPTSCNKSKN
ncbi:hypothetical protein CDAR_244221 [Caerostris darwini]|uniref:DUF4817 domain-containing protein n=1 Tax=Caerostris darwini TaxID=1538125 RepID=A0AAV4RHL8_9ARAC|nr:hypothetical protein CDAR_244221 [Caerostris darwini]